MPAHGQTITWGTHIGRSTSDVRGHWLQRIRQWLAGRPQSDKEAPTMTLYGNWDRRCEGPSSHRKLSLPLSMRRGVVGNRGSLHCIALSCRRN